MQGFFLRFLSLAPSKETDTQEGVEYFFNLFKYGKHSWGKSMGKTGEGDKGLQTSSYKIESTRWK